MGTGRAVGGAIEDTIRTQGKEFAKGMSKWIDEQIMSDFLAIPPDSCFQFIDVSPNDDEERNTVEIP